MRRELGMGTALIFLCIGLWLSNPDFLGHSNAINTLRQISMLGIFALGIGCVIVSGGVDLSVGSMIGLTGVIIAKLSSTQSGGMGYSLWVGIPIALGIALLLGLMQGLLITRLELQPFIVTLGGMLLFRGVSQTISDGGTLSLGGSPLLNLASGGVLRIAGEPLMPYPLLIFLIIIALATLVMHFTVYGRYLYAIGGNRDAAEYSGIQVKNIEASTYVISAGLAGVSGVCYAAYIGQMSQQVGIAYELYGIAAAVLGGCSLRGGEGSVLGIVLGAVLLQVLQNLVNLLGIPSSLNFAVMGGVILIGVIADQQLVRYRTRRANERKRALGVAARQEAAADS
jgi:ribose transport system permease protein